LSNISNSVISRQKDVSASPLVAIQSRLFFSNSMSNNMSSQSGATNPEQLFMAELDKLAKTQPSKALQAIENGWAKKQLPLNDHYLKLYTKLAEQLNVAHKIDLQKLQPNLGYVGSQGFGGLEQGMGGGFQQFSAGASPNSPIYTTAVDKSTFSDNVKAALMKGFGLFLAVSLLMVLLDEKTGTAGAGGGISSKLGLAGSATHQAEKSDKTFEDVVGIDEAKSDLQEIVMYLKEPDRFTKLGGKLPKGVLLTGPPGNGKTLLARAIAGEAGVPFYYTSGSEFEEMYVGVGARRVRDLFKTANESSPCIIFIDEIDAIGGSRQLKEQTAMKMTLNQLLVEMDGFKENNGTIVIAATNFPESLDSALTRPGRLDKHVEVPLPDVGGRKKILELYGSKVPLGKDVNMEQIARGTPGFSGAELSNLVNQAALKSSVDGLAAVSMSGLEYAKDKIMMGAERKTAVISPETLKCTAFHEAGHALISLKTDGADPIHKATIMPRGRALGMVMQLPDGDQTSMSRKQMLAKLDICMGGRVAEEVFFGEDNVTSGASSDFQQATRLAKAMVTKWGFSSKLGIQYNGDPKDKMSGETQTLIDNEVRTLLNDSYARALNMITEHKRELRYIAHALIEHETLSGSEIREVANGYKIDVRKRSQEPSRKPIVLPTPKTPPQIKPTVKPAAAPPVVTHSKVSASAANSKDKKEGAKKTVSNEKVDKEAGSASSKQVRGPPPL